MSTGQQTLESMSQALWYNRFTLSLFSRFLKGDILEIGCGIGNFTKELVRYGKVTAIDIEGSYISIIEKHLKGIAQVGLGDVERGKYFFKSKSFDSIICLNVLEHIKDEDKALQNIYKLLKKGGYLILLVPGHSFLYGSIDDSLGHYRRYELYNLRKKMGDLGFKIKIGRRINFLGAVGWFVAGRILKKRIVEEDKIKIFNSLAPFLLPLEKVLEPPFGTSILIVAQK